MKQHYFLKNTFLILFLVYSVFTYSQIINDNFDDGNITGWIEGTSGDWISSSDLPITSSNSLKHNLSSTSGTSYISHSSSGINMASEDVVWQFNLKNGNWDPSGSNKFWVYLTANESNLTSATVDGYAIGVNFSGSTDLLTLWKVTNGAVDSSIITTTLDWNADLTTGIKVTRSTSGLWEVLIDSDGGFDNLISEGTATNADYTFTDYFGLEFTFSSTRAGLLWLDDVLVEGSAPSTDPSIGFDTNTSSETETNTTFNTSIPVTLSNYNADVTVNIAIDGGSTAEPADYVLNTNSLTFTADGSQNISLDINDDADSDNETIILNLTVSSGTATTSISQHTITISDDDLPSIIISEIMYNTPGTDDEWIELYNNEGSDLDISDWTLEYNGNTYTFPTSTSFVNNTFITIAVGSNGDGTYNNDNPFTPDYNNLSVTNDVVKDTNSTNKLGNTSGTIILKNNLGNTIDTVTYDDGDATSTDGSGNTYEVSDIDGDNSSTGNNWQASTTSGGSPARGSNATWTGVTDNDWATSTNWANNSAPLSSSDVIIPSGLTNYPTASTSVAFNSLIIESGATFIPQSTVTGNITYTRNLPTTNWYLVSSPVDGETIEDLITNTSLATGTGSNIGLAPYDNSTPSWSYQTVASTGTLTSGQGYSIKTTAAGDISFIGTAKTSDTFVNVSRGANNFFLLGNPYTSYVNSATFIANNSGPITEQTIWLWNGTSYLTYNNASPIEIAPAQGFFVELNNDPVQDAVGIYTTNQSHQSSDTFMRQEPTNNFELSIKSEDKKAITKIFYMEGKTTGYENGYDSRIFGGVEHDFALFTELISNNEGDKLGIQTLPNNNYETMIIPVGIIAEADKEITFSVESLNLPENIDVFLEDRINGEFINLSEDAYKTTLTSDSNSSGQFYIHTTSEKLSTDDIAQNISDISIYKSAKQEITITGLQDDAKVTLYSLLGKKAFTTDISSNGKSLITIPSLAKGIYIVKLTSKLGGITKKIALD